MRLRVAMVCLLCAAGGCTTAPRATPHYQVGDVAIARNFSRYPQFNGTEVRVTGAYQWRWIKGNNTLPCYEITTVDGQALAAQEFQLLKLTARNSRDPDQIQ